MTRINHISAVFLALVLACSILAGPVGVAAAQSSASLDQTAQGSTTVAPGESVTVDVSIETTNSGSPAIELEGVPAGWEIEALDNDSGKYQSDNYEWFWLQDSDLGGNYSHTVTYEVTIPSDAGEGTYEVDAVGSSQGSGGVDDDYQDTDTLSISVESTAQSIPEAVATQNAPDDEIGLQEIQQAINWWAIGSEVPGTGGETIGLQEIQQLINVWATGATVT